jgi:hypothetical protein
MSEGDGDCAFSILELDRQLRARVDAGDNVTVAVNLDLPTTRTLSAWIAEEPDVVAITFADRQPGASLPTYLTASVETPSGAGSAFQTGFAASSVGPGSFEASTARSLPDAASMAATSVPRPER